MNRRYVIGSKALLLVLTLLLSGCSSIDEDLLDCGSEYEMEYKLCLETDINTELQSQLDQQTDGQVADALYNHLKNIFSDVAYDIDLSFYDTGKEGTLLQNKELEMGSNERSYTLFLPVHEYRHAAIANLVDNHQVVKEGEEQSHTLALLQERPDTVDSHESGLFTGRADMDVKENQNQSFQVDLYMANSAAVLIIDQCGIEVKDIKVFTTGFATGFNVNDSTYTFAKTPPIVRTTSVDTGTDQLCFCSVNFPSRDKADGDEPLWQFIVYVTLADGSVTQSVLNISEPLKAGDLKVVKAQLQEDGSLQPVSAEVGVSVTLDWKQGGSYETDI